MKIIVLLACVCGFLSWLSPYHYAPWRTAASEFFIFAALILTSVVTLQKYQTLKIPHVLQGFLLIAIIPLVQYFTGELFFFGDAFMVLLYLFAFYLAMVAGFNLGQQEEDRQKAYVVFCALILFSGLLSGVIAINQWLGLYKNIPWVLNLPRFTRPFGNFAQPNSLATFLIMSLMANLYLFEKRVLPKLVAIGFSLFFIFGIALTQSRTSVIFLLCFVVFWLWKARVLQKRLAWAAMTLGVVWYFICSYAIPVLSGYVGGSGVVGLAQRAGKGNERLQMWQQMLVAIEQKPWMGYGWNQVSVAQVETTLRYPLRIWTEHSHNIVLDVLVWNGVPLGVLILGFVAWWLLRMAASLRSIDAFLAMSMVLAVLVHGLLEYPLEYAFFLLPIGLLLGLVQAEQIGLGVRTVSLNISSWVLTLSIVLYGWIVLEYQSVGQPAPKWLKNNAVGQQVLQLAPQFPVLLLTQLSSKYQFAKTAPNQAMTAEQLEWMRQVAYRNAASSNLYRYGQALAFNHETLKAQQQLQIIKALHGATYRYTSASAISNK